MAVIVKFDGAHSFFRLLLMRHVVFCRRIMITLDNIITFILDEDHWQTFNLHMTSIGFERLSKQLIYMNQNEPQVYIHVCDEGPLKKQGFKNRKS